MKPAALLSCCVLAVLAGLSPTRAETNPATGDHVDYIPKDVPDAVRVLEKELTKDELVQVQTRNINNFFLGVGLRNSWGLWKGSRLSDWFHTHGVDDPEEMSGIVLDALVADLQKKPFDLEQALAKARADQVEEAQEEKENQRRAEASAVKIKGMMLGLHVVGKPAQVVTLPTRTNSRGVRVRYLAPFAGGFLVASKSIRDDIVFSPVFFLDLAQRTMHKLAIDGMSHVEDAFVLDEKAYFVGPGAHGEKLVCCDGKSIRAIPPPPGAGKLRFGQDGGQLLGLRPRAVYRLEDGRWSTLIETKEELPLGLLPPMKIGDRIYLRDEGQGENDKRLWWINLKDHDRITSFDDDCGVVGAEGPRWENVWSYATEPSGRLWLTPGYSLVRWDAKDGYRVALINGDSDFDGQLMKSTDPVLSQGGKILDGEAEKRAPFAATGILVRPDGSLAVIGPNGLYRLSGNEITPLLEFRNMAQLVPTGEIIPNTKEESLYHWSVDPTHLVALGHDDYLVGNHWEGLYLLARDAKGDYQFTALDEKMGTEVTLDHLPAK